MQKRIYRKRRRLYRRALQRKRSVQRKHTPDIPQAEQDEHVLNGHDLQHDPDNILHLQSTIGNQAVQRMYGSTSAKPKSSGNAFLSSFGVDLPAHEHTDEVAVDEGSSDSEQVIQPKSNLFIQKTPLQRKASPENTEDVVLSIVESGDLQSVDTSGISGNRIQRDPPPNPPPPTPTTTTTTTSSPPQRPPPPTPTVTPTPTNQTPTTPPVQPPPVQSPSLAKRIGKHVGYGVLTMVAEQVIGPFADLKHLIRQGHYSRIKKGKTGTDLQKVKDKEKKLSERVKSEWVGKYPGQTWMAVVHAMSTTSEKLAALAGAVGLLAAICSAFAPPAAVVATIAGIIGASLAGLALIGRSILTVGSYVKWKSSTNSADKEAFREMFIGNLFKSISNVLNIVTFGIGAKVGGLDFTSSGVKTGTEIGVDMAVGGSGGLFDTLVGGIGEDVVDDKVQQKRIQREDEDVDDDESSAKEAIMELDGALVGIDGEMDQEKAVATEDKSNMETDLTKLGKVDDKLANVTDKADEIKEQSGEMETELSNADTESETPTEGSASAVSKDEVKELESEVGRAEEAIDKGEKPEEQTDIKKKKGFFARIKAAAKKAGKKFKRGFKKLFLRLKSVFNRVKALIQKAKNKVTAMVLSVLGISEDVEAGHEDVKQQKDVEIPGSIESVGKQTEQIDDIKDTLKG